MAPILLSESQNKELAKKLEIYGFQSLQVRSAILTELSFKPQGLKIWVDSWPQFSTVLLIDLVHINSDSMQLCSVFTLDEEKFKEMLETPDLILWEKVKFAACPIKFKPLLQSFADRFGCSLRGPTCTFQLLALNPEKNKPREIPEGLSISTLTPDLAEHVYNKWEFKNPNSLENHVYIKILIESYPTVCIFNSEGNPIAYAIGQMYGGMGMLFVEPDYRKRGLGKLVMYLLSEKYCIGYPPFVSVATDNEISNKLHHGLGFEPTGCFINWFSLRKN